MIFWPLKLAFKIISTIVLIVVLYLGITFVQIWLRGHEHTTQNADAILVFGSASYGRNPSGDLADRLHAAYQLFEEGRAPVILVTGSKQPGDIYTEAQVSLYYLERQKPPVPSGDIVLGGGIDTWQNVSSIVPYMTKHHLHSVITVTDPFHEYRAMAITTDQGLTPYPFAISQSAVRGTSLFGLYFKETLEVAAGRFVGFHTLSNWFHG